MQSKIDEKIETTTGTIIISFFFAVLKFFRCCWYGFTELYNKVSWIKFTMITLIVFLVGILLTNTIKASIITGFIFIIYLFILGIKYQKRIDKIVADAEAKKEALDNRFLSIGFKDKLNCTPKLVETKSINEYFEEKYFWSNIPLDEWKKNKNKIEEIFNTRIISININPDNSNFKIAKCSKLHEPTIVKFDRKYLSKNPYEIFIGLDIYGQPTYLNLFKKPHTIVAGSTNSGKSTTAFSFFTQLKQHECNRIILCDFKRVTFKSLVKYNNKPAIDNRDNFIKMLNWIQKENQNRINLFNNFEDCENLKEYNKLCPGNQLKNIFIFVDELAVIMKDKDTELENLIQDLTQTGRSQGIYLLVFTQRPSAKTVPAEARANFTSRLCYIQEDKGTSEMAIGDDSALKLPNIEGRCILKLGGEKVEVQAVYLPKDEISLYLDVAKVS